jgi:hypothetical protein
MGSFEISRLTLRFGERKRTPKAKEKNACPTELATPSKKFPLILVISQAEEQKASDN